MSIKNLTNSADTYIQQNDLFKDVDEVHAFDGNDTIDMGWADFFGRLQGNNDLVDGGYGNDIIATHLGNDILRGGPGNDELDGGIGDDQLLGGDGDDILHLSEGNDTYDGGAGYDILDMTFTPLLGTYCPGQTMEGTTSDGFVFCGPGGGSIIIDIAANDISNIEELRFLGGSTVIDDGSDHKLVGLGSDITVDGGGGRDTIIAVSGHNVLSGGSGDDYITGGTDDDTIDGGTGDDIIDAGFGNDAIDGGGGTNDYLLYHTSDSFTGADFATINLAAGTAVRSAIVGRTFQTIETRESDTLTGIESVIGSSMKETIIGTVGANHLYGRGGDDTIDGGYGNDVLGGDGGVNTVSFASWTAGISDTIDLAAGLATRTSVTLGVGGFTTGIVETDQLFGFQNVTGSALADTIKGDSGDNVLDGRLGNDAIDGGLGNDTIIGGAGVDTMTGGTGSDTFRFLSAADMPIGGYVADNIDRIRDFQDAGSNQDVIDLSAIRTSTGGHLFFSDGDGNAYEKGEVMVFATAARGTELTADLDGDGNLDFAVRLDQVITTIDAGDFIF